MQSKARISLESSKTRDHRLNRHLETDRDDINELKDAIIELYLAIKIRSTEEVCATFLFFDHWLFLVGCDHR